VARAAALRETRAEAEMGESRDFETIESRKIFQGRVLELRVDRVRLANDRVSELEVVRHPGAVAVVAITADGSVLMVRQFRYAIGDWLLEVPAGKLDPGEEPAAAAGRELEEETGYRAGRLEPLGRVWTTPGFTNETIDLFLALDLEAAEQALQDDEMLTVERVPLERAVAQALDGTLRDSKSVCCLLRAADRMRRA
jgi:ADP-ribose diphosphatase